MATLEKKSDILTLLGTPLFQDMLTINSYESFLEVAHAHRARIFQHFENSWSDDPNEADGVRLFSTPKRGSTYGSDFGTWVAVSKLYGDNERPFAVSGLEFLPMGKDIEHIHIGHFRTLGEALDTAFLAHEHGTFDLHAIPTEDKPKGESKAEPASPAASEWSR